MEVLHHFTAALAGQVLESFYFLLHSWGGKPQCVSVVETIPIKSCSQMIVRHLQGVLHTLYAVDVHIYEFLPHYRCLLAKLFEVT
jgi:hypothetical protein